MLTNTLPTTPFNSIFAPCAGGRNCIPQPGTANRIDFLQRQRPLFRLAYRNFGTHESLVTNQSVSAGTGPNGVVAGIRWYELRSPNSSPVIFQEGTYAPGLTDGIHRWMGSIAMNSLGDIALGFSASNGTNPSVFPSVFYTARHDGDPPGQMTLGEGSIINGTGSQTGSQRWGDYSAIDVDPTDDTTFWYINSTFRPPARLDGDCESARSTWPAHPRLPRQRPHPARQQRQLRRRQQLLQQLLRQQPQLLRRPRLQLQLRRQPQPLQRPGPHLRRELRQVRGLVPRRRRDRSEFRNSFVGEADSFPYS